MSVVSIRFNDDEEEYDLKSVQEYLRAKSEGTLNLIPFEEAIKEWDIRHSRWRTDYCNSRFWTWK